MKQFALLAVALFGAIQLGSAAPICVNGSLSSYIALGSSGCMIGTNLFSQFTETSLLTGAMNIPPASLTVTPLGATTNPGLTFSGSVTATSGQTLDALINYVISGNSYTSDTITLANTSASGNGAVTDIQNFCRNGNFTSPTFVSGCPGGEGPGSPLLVYANGSSQATIIASSLGITHNLTIDSGGSGTASGATVTDRFVAVSAAAVPEPSSSVFVCTGLGIAFALSHRLRASEILRKKETNE